VAGLPGFGKTSLINRLLADWSPSPAVQFACADGKVSAAYEGDYADWVKRMFAFVGDDLEEANKLFRQLVELRRARSASVLWPRRPDTSTTTFLVKVKLTPDMDIAAAKAQIGRFVDSVAKTGRSTLTVMGEPTLSVVNPDQYRGQIADLIAADAATMKVKFGPDYGVNVSGLDRPVEWARAGPVDVVLYLPSTYTVTRK
jgi:GTPase SAR1 family protein